MRMLLGLVVNITENWRLTIRHKGGQDVSFEDLACLLHHQDFWSDALGAKGECLTHAQGKEK